MTLNKQALASEILTLLEGKGLDAADVKEVLHQAEETLIARDQQEVRGAISKALGPNETDLPAAETIEYQERLLAECIKHGRSICHTSIGKHGWEERKKSGKTNSIGNTGFQNIIDYRTTGIDQTVFRGLPAAAVQSLGMTTINQHQWNEYFASQGVSSVVSIAPVFLDGTKKQPLPLSKFTRNASDTEQAYQFIYAVMGNDQRPYKDPSTQRSGNVFIGMLMLPKAKAEEALAHAKQDPRFARELFRRMEPEVLKEQEGKATMPADANVAILPDDTSGYEWSNVDGRRKRVAVKKEYIVSVQ